MCANVSASRREQGCVVVRSRRVGYFAPGSFDALALRALRPSSDRARRVGPRCRARRRSRAPPRRVPRASALTRRARAVSAIVGDRACAFPSRPRGTPDRDPPRPRAAAALATLRPRRCDARGARSDAEGNGGGTAPAGARPPCRSRRGRSATGGTSPSPSASCGRRLPDEGRRRDDARRANRGRAPRLRRALDHARRDGPRRPGHPRRLAFSRGRRRARNRS